MEHLIMWNSCTLNYQPSNFLCHCKTVICQQKNSSRSSQPSADLHSISDWYYILLISTDISSKQHRTTTTTTTTTWKSSSCRLKVKFS